mmetsp:Transcript_50854/g.76034  ORF Transcript_50854/g.76034 Transcript_50854/m.76034 type:complete len:239 (+) Transcript_50854:474-1190(+)
MSRCQWLQTRVRAAGMEEDMVMDIQALRTANNSSRVTTMQVIRTVDRTDLLKRHLRTHRHRRSTTATWDLVVRVASSCVTSAGLATTVVLPHSPPTRRLAIMSITVLVVSKLATTVEDTEDMEDTVDTEDTEDLLPRRINKGRTEWDRTRPTTCIISSKGRISLLLRMVNNNITGKVPRTGDWVPCITPAKRSKPAMAALIRRRTGMVLPCPLSILGILHSRLDSRTFECMATNVSRT